MSNLGKTKCYIEIYSAATGLSKDIVESFDIWGKQIIGILSDPRQSANRQNITYISGENEEEVFVIPKSQPFFLHNIVATSTATNTGGRGLTQSIAPPKKEEVPATDTQNIPYYLSWQPSYITQNDNFKTEYPFLCQFLNIPDTLELFRPCGDLENWVNKTILNANENENGKKTPSSPSSQSNAQKENLTYHFVVSQNVCHPNLLWRASTTILNEKAVFPFFISIQTQKPAVKNAGLPSFFAILLNLFTEDINIKTSNDTCFTLLFVRNRIYLVDYSLQSDITYKTQLQKQQEKEGEEKKEEEKKEGETKKGETSQEKLNFLVIDTNLTYDDLEINIGVMPLVGKLCLISKEKSFIYTRISKDTSPSTDPSTPNNSQIDNIQNLFHFYPREITILGSNCQATIALYPMTFPSNNDDSNVAVLLPQIWGAYNPSTKKNDKEWLYTSDGQTLESGDKYYLINGTCGRKNLGVFCQKFNDKDLDISGCDLPSELLDGNCRAGAINCKLYPNATTGNKEMVIELISHTLNEHCCSNNFVITDINEFKCYCGFPILMRLRGVSHEIIEPVATNKIATIYDVISLTDKFDSQELFAATRSLDITLYNPNGQYNYLNDQSYCIKAYLSRGTKEVVTEPFFTGIILDGSQSEVAGKEILTIHCEDYMRILSDNLFVNSPFYDGMDVFYAVKNIAQRAGIQNIIDDTDQNKRYFLPCGYSYTEPKLRFPENQNLKDAIIDMVKLCERMVYFDNNGALHVDYLQGGLMYSGVTQNDIVAYFYRDPSALDDEIILDEKRTEKLLGSVVNEIFVRSVDRATGQPILTHHTAGETSDWFTAITTNKIPYKKMLFLSQAALGNLSNVREWVCMLAERVYKVPSQITIRTVSYQNIKPFDFIAIDGLKYRVTSMQRQYNAETNSIETTLSGKWLGSTESQNIA